MWSLTNFFPHRELPADRRQVAEEVYQDMKLLVLAFHAAADRKARNKDLTTERRLLKTL